MEEKKNIEIQEDEPLKQPQQEPETKVETEESPAKNETKCFAIVLN